MEQVESQESANNELPAMPIDNAQAYLDWLVNCHDYDTVMSLPVDKRPNAYDYKGITAGEVEIALDAIKAQRVGQPEEMLEILKDLNPAQITLLARDPEMKLLTMEEMEALRHENTREEIERLRKLPGTEAVISVPYGYDKYMHATPKHRPEYIQSINTHGLYCHETGLAGVAVGLSQDMEANLRGLAQRHKNHRGVVTIVIQRPTSEELISRMAKVRGPLGRVWTDTLLARKLSETEAVKMWGTGLDYDYVLPRKFIEGYIDTQTGDFIKNPNFDPNLTAEDIGYMEKRMDEIAAQQVVRLPERKPKLSPKQEKTQ